MEGGTEANRVSLGTLAAHTDQEHQLARGWLSCSGDRRQPVTQYQVNMSTTSSMQERTRDRGRCMTMGPLYGVAGQGSET